MKITRNAVYNFIHDAVADAYPSMYIAGAYEPVSPSKPAVFISEIGDFRNRENMTFSGAQGIRTSTVEIQIVSGRMNGSLSEAYAILEIVRNACFRLFYNEANVIIVENGDNGTNYRLRATYRRVIGDADEMPTN